MRNTLAMKKEKKKEQDSRIQKIAIDVVLKYLKIVFDREAIIQKNFPHVRKASKEIRIKRIAISTVKQRYPVANLLVSLNKRGQNTKE